MDNKLLTPENIKSVALALAVALSGGSVWQGKTNQGDIDTAVHEIHALHDQLNPMLQRQKNMEEMLKKLTGTP